jgi:hypothetical protein
VADGTFLVFISKPSGYELVELPGSPPAVGDELEHGELRMRVTKVASSPLPADPRTCAYVEAA